MKWRVYHDYSCRFRRRKIRTLILSSIFVFITQVTAQQDVDEVSVSGVVIHRWTENPVNDVIVRVLDAQLEATTTSDGTFKFLQIPEGLIPENLDQNTIHFSLQQGLIFWLSVYGKVEVRIHDISGREVTRVTSSLLEKGYHQFFPPRMGKGVYFAKISTPNVTKGFQFVIYKETEWGVASTGKFQSGVEDRELSGLGKHLAQPVDSLEFFKEGYITQRVPLESWDQSGIKVEMVAESDTNSRLEGLTLSVGKLGPEFNEDVLEYGVAVPYETSVLTLKATAKSHSAAIGFNGEKGSEKEGSLQISPEVGENTVTVTVTARDSSHQTTYQLNILREVNYNGAWYGYTEQGREISFSISAGRLSRVDYDLRGSFCSVSGQNSGTLTNVSSTGFFYMGSTFGIEGIFESPTESYGGALYNDCGTAVVNWWARRTTTEDLSNPLPQAVIVDRPKTLTVVHWTHGGDGTINQSIDASSEDEVVSFKMFGIHPDATVEIDGMSYESGKESAEYPLVVGENEILMNVHSADGSASQKILWTVIRATSSNNDLEELSAGSDSWGVFSLDPAFSPDVNSYSIEVEHDVDSLWVKAEVAHSLASLSINGENMESGVSTPNIGLNVGDNTITIIVKALDGSTNNITLAVFRKGSPDSELSDLSLSKGVLSPGFQNWTNSYTTEVASDVTKINITPTTSHPEATVKVNGTPVGSGEESEDIILEYGINIIDIEVIAEDPEFTTTYSVTVERALNMNINIDSIQISWEGGAIVLDSNSLVSGDCHPLPIEANIIYWTPYPSVSSTSIELFGNALGQGEISNPIELSPGTNLIDYTVLPMDPDSSESRALSLCLGEEEI